MNWIFLLIGIAIGLITGYFCLILYILDGLYGRMMTDHRDPEHYIFRLEFTQDPAKFPKSKKYMIFKVEETELKSIKTEE